jgi:hypothetical protein
MNKTILNTLAALAFAATPLMAVPSGINYQGALTDDQGNPITGTRTMSIKLYDAATDGTLLYTEDLGTVDVSDGVFSFEFGTNGTSNAEQSDTVSITDGTATTFQKVLPAAQVVAGTVTVTDGTYSWSQSGGSSNEDNFSVVYSTNLRRVTVAYLNGAPAAGRTITATYRTPASGISGALAGNNQPWAEITVDGVAQVPRQKILTVPFAAVSGLAVRATSVTSPHFGVVFQPPLNGVALSSPPYPGGLSNPPFTYTMFQIPVFLPRGIQNVRIKLPVGWGQDVYWADATYKMHVQIFLGETMIDELRINGRTGITAPVMSFDIDKTFDLEARGVQLGLTNLRVVATLSDYTQFYGSTSYRISGGSSSPWIISEPSGP